ncbi:hypothetical protein TKK_0006262 [Trichogramma kaykai]
MDKSLFPNIRIFFRLALERKHLKAHGYSYFHGACFAGNIEAVERFISEGVDVNLGTYTCSPLHIASQHRHNEIVKILLKEGANPNQLSHKNSTPLHALAQLCVCYCLDLCTDTTDCNERRPVDEIVNMLIKKGANIEARNSDGYTSLEFAASRLDYELVRTLLKHVLGVRSSPITLHIVEMIRLLLSNGFIMDFDVRLKILKFWMTVRRHDIKYLIPDIHDFFMKQEDVDYLQKICEQFRLKVPEYLKRQNAENFTNKLEIEVTKMKSILVNGDISLFQICQMSYVKGYSVLKKMKKNWRLPALHDLKILNRFVHVANIMMRPQFERFAADLFMTDNFRLNLPYYICREIVEYLSDEDLFRLC